MTDPFWLSIIVATITSVGGGAVIWVRQKGREPLEQESLAVATAHKAMESLQISNTALHEDVKRLSERYDSEMSKLSEQSQSATVQLRDELQAERVARQTETQTLRAELERERADRRDETAQWRRYIQSVHLYVELLRDDVQATGTTPRDYPVGYWQPDGL